MLQNILNKQTFKELTKKRNVKDLIKDVQKEFIDKLKHRLEDNELEYWGDNLGLFAEKFICNRSKHGTDWDCFQEIMLPHTRCHSEEQFRHMFEGPYREFKSLVIEPLNYINKFIESSINNYSDTDEESYEDSEEESVAENECKCDNYAICYNDERPYVVNKKNDILSVIEPDKHDSKECKGQKLKGTFELCPQYQRDRECILISGPSGSGKTYFAKEYLRKYNKLFPDNLIVLIGNKDFEDFDDIDYLKYPLDEKDVMQLQVNDFEDSIIVFDDVENISHIKKIQERIIAFMEETLNVGRTMHISMIIVSHILMNYKFSKLTILECNRVVMFPNSGVRFQYINFLTKYIGLTKKQIEKVLKTRSRWLCIDKECPLTVMTKSSIEIIN